MATIDSDKVEKALMGKMKANRTGHGDWLYTIRDEEGVIICITSLSKGAKETLGSARVSLMSRQLRLSKTRQFIDLVSCTLSQKDALRIMKSNPPNNRLSR